MRRRVGALARVPEAQQRTGEQTLPAIASSTTAERPCKADLHFGTTSISIGARRSAARRHHHPGAYVTRKSTSTGVREEAVHARHRRAARPSGCRGPARGARSRTRRRALSVKLPTSAPVSGLKATTWAPRQPAAVLGHAARDAAGLRSSWPAAGYRVGHAGDVVRLQHAVGDGAGRHGDREHHRARRRSRGGPPVPVRSVSPIAEWPEPEQVTELVQRHRFQVDAARARPAAPPTRRSGC